MNIKQNDSMGWFLTGILLGLAIGASLVMFVLCIFKIAPTCEHGNMSGVISTKDYYRVIKIEIKKVKRLWQIRKEGV